MIFCKCKKCGNFVTFLGEKTACTPECCGETMSIIEANTTDGAREKHVPAVEVNGNTVKAAVGSVTHPMMPEHYIQFIILETDKGFYKRDLKPEQAPEATFTIADDEKPVAVYENCNLHGLWKAEM